MAKSPNISRNDFVKITVGALGAVIGAVVGIPAIFYLISPASQKQEADAWIPAGPLENYPVGTPTLFSFTRSKITGWEKTVNSYGVYILRRSEAPEDILAFSNICTHLSCRVKWDEVGQDYVCPCHDGHFGINGEVLSGPPPRPLDAYEIKIEAGALLVHFVEA